MTAAPWFKFYARDWLSSESVRLMGNARGDFVDLLCLQSIEGSIPGDPESIRQLVGRGKKEWPSLWSRLEPKFPLCDDGRRRNAKQGDVIDEQESYLENRRVSGSKGGSKRVANSKQTASSPQAQLQAQLQANPNQADTEEDKDSLSVSSASTGRRASPVPPDEREIFAARSRTNSHPVPDPDAVHRLVAAGIDSTDADELLAKQAAARERIGGGS